MSPRPNIDHIRRPQLIAAAAEVISERGLAATRISDVAERAGTSSAAVLYWFDSKDDLLAAALSWEEERFYSELTARLADGLTPGERMALFIEASSVGGEWTLWVEFWCRALRDAEAARTRESLDQRWRGAIAEIARDGQLSGEFDQRIAPDDVAATMAALLDGLAVQISLGDKQMPPERMVVLARQVAEDLLGCELPQAPQFAPVEAVAA